MIGRTVSHYRIESSLGAGGMGVVYRARDLRLQRDVAIKVLPDLAVASDSARREFRKEALTLSRLNHPHIGTIYDFDHDQEIDFLVLELVEGTTLSDEIRSRPFDEVEIARLGEQLAQGLAAAHREGVLHRDIKPANLRITPDRRLKILDFGLAKLTRAPGTLSTRTESAPGEAAGTLPYMSPEQLRGESLDARSDIYSAGAVLYEMATGVRAFPQTTAAAVAGAVLSSSPKPLRQIRDDRSVDLERIVACCLERDPAKRYASAADLANDLSQLALPPERRARARGRRSSIPWRPVGAAAAGLLVIAAIGGVATDLGGFRTRLFDPPQERTLAVLPLTNLSGNPDHEYFADGMTDELITRLAQVGALRVISRSSVMLYKGSKKPSKQIARELGVDLLVEGSVARSSERVRISAQLVDARRDRNVWADSYERLLSDVLSVQSDVARAVVENVKLRITPEERRRIGTARPVNVLAHEEYLRGIALFNIGTVEGLQACQAAFQRSIIADPGYAPAYAGLANSYFFLSSSVLPAKQAIALARPAAARALELDSTLAAAHVSMAVVKTYDWEWTESERGLLRALALSPSDAGVHQYLGAVYTSLGRFAEAERAIARARVLDPLNPLVAAMSLWPLFEGRQFERAVAEGRLLVEAHPEMPNLHMVLGQSLLMSGMKEEGIAEIQKAVKLDPKNPFPQGWLAFAYGVSGKRSQAREILSSLEERTRTGYVQPYLFALVHAGLGENKQALDYLEQAAEARSDELLFLQVDPGLDALRREPRFQAILDRMNFPKRTS